jgi:hypothetical protein
MLSKEESDARALDFLVAHRRKGQVPPRRAPLHLHHDRSHDSDGPLGIACSTTYNRPGHPLPGKGIRHGTRCHRVQVRAKEQVSLGMGHVDGGNEIGRSFRDLLDCGLDTTP